jgi:hypothetical protein
VPASVDIVRIAVARGGIKREQHPAAVGPQDLVIRQDLAQARAGVELHEQRVLHGGVQREALDPDVLVSEDSSATPAGDRSADAVIDADYAADITRAVSVAVIELSRG